MVTRTFRISAVSRPASWACYGTAVARGVTRGEAEGTVTAPAFLTAARESTVI